MALSNFITDIIDADLEAGRHDSVVTRFPPEPNGYLHIGHAKSICLNFGLAQQYGGRCHLRFDDTNPVAEDEEYVEAIKGDVQWLGFDWGEHLFWASDYFPQMYAFAEELVKKGLAYVDSLSLEKLREYRGNFTTPGTNSPDRDRSVEENLDLFHRMKAGEFPDGSLTLRAKIDMAHPNMIMRDPLLYRIKRATHHNTGDDWCIYPMYDFAHCLEDSIEHITHSICTLEFDNNRAIYDWVLDNVSAPARPHQYEFARLNLDYTVMSKRKLLQLVVEGHVSGWDDPRMLTIAGLRRRGVRPEAIRAFAELVGVAKHNSLVDTGKLEYAIRDDLNWSAPRAFAVVEPLSVTISNPASSTLEAPSWPDDAEKSGTRALPFGANLIIDRSDFAEAPPEGWKRLSPGATVRLRYGPMIRCDEVKKAGDVVVGLVASIVDDSPIGTIHWLDADTAVDAELRIYDRLFGHPAPDGDPDVDFKERLNPNSLLVVKGAKVEPSMAGTPGGAHFQFERLGYFFSDPVDSAPGKLVFNRTVTLKDSWVGSDDADMEELRAEKDRAREEQAKKSESGKKDPRQVAEERGDGSVERFDALVAAGVPPASALSISATDERYGFVIGAGSFAAHAESTAKAFSNFTSPLWGDDGAPYTSDVFGAFVAHAVEKDLSGSAIKRIHAEMAKTGAFDPAAGAGVGGDAVSAAVDSVVSAHPDEAERFAGGEAKLMGFFIGQVMRSLGGKADGGAVRKALLARLNG